MTQSAEQPHHSHAGQRDVNWHFKYRSVWTFVQIHRRYPSRHHPEEHILLNWMKYNRRLINKGLLSEDKILLLKKLEELRKGID